MSTILERVHETRETVATVEETPPHPPREDTPIYRAAHHHLVDELDTPCRVCGVRKSTLADPRHNPLGATQLETHHLPVERSLIDACDWQKVARDYPAVTCQEALLDWVDSAENLVVLCDVHHRSVEHGIHHLLTQDWAIQPYLLTSYVVAATPADADALEASDQALVGASA